MTQVMSKTSAEYQIAQMIVTYWKLHGEKPKTMKVPRDLIERLKIEMEPLFVAKESVTVLHPQYMGVSLIPSDKP